MATHPGLHVQSNAVWDRAGSRPSGKEARTRRVPGASWARWGLCRLQEAEDSDVGLVGIIFGAVTGCGAIEGIKVRKPGRGRPLKGVKRLVLAVRRTAVVGWGCKWEAVDVGHQGRRQGPRLWEGREMTRRCAGAAGGMWGLPGRGAGGLPRLTGLKGRK